MPSTRLSSQKTGTLKLACGALALGLVFSSALYATESDCPPGRRRDVIMNVLVGARTQVSLPTAVDLSRISSWHGLESGSVFYLEGETTQWVFQNVIGPRGQENQLLLSELKGTSIRTVDMVNFPPEHVRIRRRPGLPHDLLPAPVAQPRAPLVRERMVMNNTVRVDGQVGRVDGALELPTTAIRSPEQMQQAVRSNFEGTNGLPVSPEPHEQNVRVPDGFTRAKVAITFSVEDIEYARTHGLLFENTPLASLPRGHAYNYVIFEDGSVHYGQLTDSWEFGVQHRTLARGKKIRAAGQLLLMENGSYRFNVDSIYSGGLFSPTVSGHNPDGRLPQRVQNIFDRSLRSGDAPAPASPGIYTRGVNLSHHGETPPTRQQLEELCRNPVFTYTNNRACFQLFGR